MVKHYFFIVGSYRLTTVATIIGDGIIRGRKNCFEAYSNFPLEEANYCNQQSVNTVFNTTNMRALKEPAGFC